MARQEFPRKVRAAIIERAGGKCEACGAAVKPRGFEIDHIIPCALGGEATVPNGRLLCPVCHKAKSHTDVKQIRKADRQRDKSSGAIRPRQKIRGRGFEKAQRNPKPSLPPKRLFVSLAGRGELWPAGKGDTE